MTEEARKAVEGFDAVYFPKMTKAEKQKLEELDFTSPELLRNEEMDAIRLRLRALQYAQALLDNAGKNLDNSLRLEFRWISQDLLAAQVIKLKKHYDGVFLGYDFDLKDF